MRRKLKTFLSLKKRDNFKISSLKILFKSHFRVRKIFDRKIINLSTLVILIHFFFQTDRDSFVHVFTGICLEFFSCTKKV